AKPPAHPWRAALWETAPGRRSGYSYSHYPSPESVARRQRTSAGLRVYDNWFIGNRVKVWWNAGSFSGFPGCPTGSGSRGPYRRLRTQHSAEASGSTLEKSMKKTLLALAAIAASSAAFAQSSVTLYGVVDASLESVRGDKTVTRVSSDNLSSSRFGLKGSEDLGGGTRANFALEAALKTDTGAADGTFWSRQAW